MLRESFPNEYVANGKRRWFSDEYFDLIIWFNQKGAVSGFQLCYDKYEKERALTWSDKTGYKHERIDDGESNPSKNLSPILVPDGICPTQELIELFLLRSQEIDPQLRSFVILKLRAYHDMFRAV